jgi:hypothetical protein
MYSLKARSARGEREEMKLIIGFKLYCQRLLYSAVGRDLSSWLAVLTKSKDPGMRSS